MLQEHSSQTDGAMDLFKTLPRAHERPGKEWPIPGDVCSPEPGGPQTKALPLLDRNLASPGDMEATEENKTPLLESAMLLL